jgi:hypothetical protein
MIDIKVIVSPFTTLLLQNFDVPTSDVAPPLGHGDSPPQFRKIPKMGPPPLGPEKALGARFWEKCNENVVTKPSNQRNTVFLLFSLGLYLIF